MITKILLGIIAILLTALGLLKKGTQNKIDRQAEKIDTLEGEVVVEKAKSTAVQKRMEVEEELKEVEVERVESIKGAKDGKEAVVAINDIIVKFNAGRVPNDNGEPQ